MLILFPLSFSFTQKGIEFPKFLQTAVVVGRSVAAGHRSSSPRATRLFQSRVEDPTGLTGTEVDLEGYAEASEGHVPQGNQSFPEEVHEGEEFYGADEFMF
uniref:Uncharacterized protein n=1 Tax=Oryza glumipatula TaxID=40148 RepID=A0A0E0B8M5_9ORYZ